VVFSKLAAPQLTTSNNTKCPLAPECTPQGYTNAWACKVSGQPNCSTLASASLPELVATAPSNPLQSLIPILFPSATPAPIDCTSSLQSKINTAASGSTLDLTGCTFTGSYTISHPITLKGVTIKPSAGTSGITIASSNVALDGVHIIGVQSNSFNSSENGVQVSGAISNLAIKNSEIAQFGQAGLWLASVTNLTIQNNQIHDIYYVGIMVLSGHGGNISNNLVQRIGMSNTTAGKTPDVGNNAYGIALSQINSTASTNFAVDSNTIEDVPTWHGLDTHGGTYINFTNNIVRRVSRAIFITTSVSRPNHINVTGNQFLSPSPVTFNLEAITTFSTDYVTITGNTIAGWNGNTIQDYNKLSTNLVVSGNTILSAGSVELSGNFLYH
jgi:parallel beta-helix repeat protein